MAARVAIGLALVALIGGSIYFVSKMGGPADVQPVADAGKDAPPAQAPSFELDSAPPEIDFDAIPEVVGEIDGQPVKKDALVAALKEFQNMAAKSSQKFDPEHLQQVKDQILGKIIDSDMFIMQASREGVDLSPEEVDQKFEEWKASFQGEENFSKFLTARNKTPEQMREEVRRGYIIRKLLDTNVISKIVVDDAQAREYYDMYPEKFKKGDRIHASHILAMASDTNNKEARAKAKEKAEAWLAKLKDGADFAELAKSESDDPQSGKNGGDLDFFTREEMVPQFSEAAFALEPGKMSGVVETQFGYHIILVHGKKPAGSIPFEEAKETLKQQMKYSQTNEKIKDYIDKLHQDLNVKVIDADGKLNPVPPLPRRPSMPGHG